MNPRETGEDVSVTLPADLEPGVSVLVRTSGGVDQIENALDSLATQTLEKSLYEVVVIPNGPDEGTIELLRDFKLANPDLQLRIVRSPVKGIGSSMNVGVAAARREYLTVVDDDDRVSTEFLKALLKISEPDTIGHGFLANVDADGTGHPDFDTYVNRSVSKAMGRTVHPEVIPSSLMFNTAKVVWTAHAQAVRARENLRFATDVVFWNELVNAFQLKIRVATSRAHAVYYRSLRVGSHSRPADISISRELGIGSRLDAIEALFPLAQDTSQYVNKLAFHAVKAQVRGIGTYLRTNPDDHMAALAAIADRGFEDFPWKSLNRGRARDLVTCYLFPPSNNTSALVAGRRVRERGVCVDVITQDLRSHYPRDLKALRILTPYVGNRKTLNRVPGFSSWKSMAEYANSGIATIEEWEEAQGPYRSVYSRAMWPASHVLAAMAKVRRPETRWIAEFSDPLSRDVHGGLRKGKRPADELSRVLERGMVTAGQRPLDEQVNGNGTLMPWIEHLAYALADEIIFTNEHQRTYMLQYIAGEDLRQSVLDRSVISPHPTLPTKFYHWSEAQLDREPDKVHLAYFGAFYATRGLTEVVDAIKRLPADSRKRLVFHVYTRDPEELRGELRAAGLDDTIKANHYVPYLDFLHLTTQFDCLIVNDARTLDSHPVNPYLPSKLSDYSGSGTPIWAVVEPGSILSRANTTYRSDLGDVDGALRVLTELANSVDA